MSEYCPHGQVKCGGCISELAKALQRVVDVERREREAAESHARALVVAREDLNIIREQIASLREDEGRMRYQRNEAVDIAHRASVDRDKARDAIAALEAEFALAKEATRVSEASRAALRREADRARAAESAAIAKLDTAETDKADAVRLALLAASVTQ